jgi:dTDP-4-amino-4,6-dideoxygalactose transaminase
MSQQHLNGIYFDGGIDYSCRIMQVPLFDLKEQYRALEPEILEALQPFLRQQLFILGAPVEQFEKSLATYCSTAHAVGLSSGTDALLVAMEALEIGPGDEVILPAFTFYATATTIIRRGAKPVFVDIVPDDFNIDAQQAVAVVNGRTKAMMPVHLFGQSAQMEPLLEAASSKGFAIIEDAAQAIGAEFNGKRVGSLGRFGAFSFYPTKNLGAFGDAGALTMQSAVDYEKVKSLRMHGMRGHYNHELIGGCFRLDALQAVILEIKLKRLENWHVARQKNAAFYARELKGVGDLVLPAVDPTRRHIFNQYTIRTRRRDDLKKFLTGRGIGTNIYYPDPVPLTKGLAHMGYKSGEFPVSEKTSREVLALPIYPELTEAQLAKVVEEVKAFFA